MFRVVYIILLFVMSAGCDRFHMIQYKAVNHTDGTIRITYNQMSFKDSTFITGDSVITLQAGETKILATREVFGGNHVWNPEAGNTYIWFFPKFIAVKNDTIPANDSLRKMIYWEYREREKNVAEIAILILSNNFE